MRMRVIKAEHLETATACAPYCVDVILRVDAEACRLLGDVTSRDRFGDAGRRSDEEAAAFAWRLADPVGDHDVERCPRNRHSASTAIAIPIPRPMQSDATP